MEGKGHGEDDGEGQPSPQGPSQGGVLGSEEEPQAQVDHVILTEAPVLHIIQASGYMAVAVVTEQVMHPLGVVITSTQHTLVPILPTLTRIQLLEITTKDIETKRGRAKGIIMIEPIG